LATLTLEHTKSNTNDKNLNTDTKPTQPSHANPSMTMSIKDPILEQKFIKVLDDTSNENNFDKRLANIKTQYENKKLEELLIRLNETEKKNEFLNSVVSKLQEKRNTNSAYKYEGFVLSCGLIVQLRIQNS
jgi:hypothetical protein